MPDLVLDLLKYVFLVVLYIFVARAVKAAWAELRPQAAPAQPRGSAEPKPGRRARKLPRKASVIEGGKLKGKSFELGDELIIGRAERCHVVLDDSYASQMHARIFTKDDGYMIEDLGSTNGTYINRKRVTAPTGVQRGDQVKIGKTVLELRR